MYVAGLALIGVGLRGVVADVGVAGWAVWFVGAAVLHDGVLVPAVLVAGAATGLLPAAWRPPVRVALIVAGCVSAVALPLVLGYGRRADVPSQLPLPYGRNLTVVLSLIAAAAVLAGAARWWAGRRRRRPPASRRAGARDGARREDGGPRR